MTVQSATVSDEIFIVLPAYNEGEAIAEVLRELTAAWRNVIVVDDGSTDATASVALRSGATVLRHVVNRGQGAALQTGITYALREGAAVVVTFDSDGQHRAADIPRLVEPVLSGAADAALGSRFLGSTEKMPKLRRLLLTAAVGFTRVASGARLTDTHNGLRAFSRAAAMQIDLHLDRMAHASEIIDQIISSGIRYVEVPVHVRYSDYSRRKGQSSFGALRVLIDYLWGRWLR